MGSRSAASPSPPAPEAALPGSSPPPLPRGRIHDSFSLTLRGPGGPRRILLQRLNRRVFPDLPAVMENVRRVTEHLRRKLERSGVPDPHRRVLTLVPTREGRDHVRDRRGDVWRAYRFIEKARPPSGPVSPAVAREAARAYGRFLRDLADLPPPPLRVTIPGFHDTPDRFRALLRAVEADPRGRAAGAREEIEFALRREALGRVLADARREGRIPARVVHNDTKLDNVLFDDATGEALCVVDLDTVMEGIAPSDFGDLVRSVANRGPPGREVLAALREGFLEGAGGLLTDEEIALLPRAGAVIAYEAGLRFLTDHLLGDRYFRVSSPGENLLRCRTQFRIVRYLEDLRARS